MRAVIDLQLTGNARSAFIAGADPKILQAFVEQVKRAYALKKPRQWQLR
ncbi:hypothetical protein [Bradyrhizobium sp. BWA-3-5]|nr:hypothetical protein [Bradyrhizobium sp. BWA-3-5]WOH63616.1 hypothetical protein RX331_23145 [Bradyrhizobium sp. BWA-3-5]